MGRLQHGPGLDKEPLVNNSVLITGGAGFIGRHLCRALLARGYQVRVVDELIEQVHARQLLDPALRDVELIVGTVRNPDLMARAVRGVDAVVHLAAEVGVGQSMYEIDRYVGANDLGTAVLLQALLAAPVRRVVVASSMSVYGEGLYRAADGTLIEDAARGPRIDGWDPVDAAGQRLAPQPTPEWKRPSLASVYAITKFVQERLVLTVAPAYGMQGIALRLFNVYGPGQALSNPYTGVLAIFASRLLNGKPPQVFEDGAQRRDFVHVERRRRRRSCGRSRRPRCTGGVFNIGSGKRQHPRDRRAACRAMGVPSWFRRSLARRAPAISATASPISGWRASSSAFRRDATLAEGMAEFAEWVQRQQRHGPCGRSAAELEAAGAGGMSPRWSPVLITGGAGFIGSTLADRLARPGNACACSIRWPVRAWSANLTWLRARHPGLDRLPHRRYPRR